MNKRILVLVLTFCTFMLLSCKKDKQTQNELENLSSLTKEVLQLPGLQQMKEAQSLLSLTERQELWEAKLSVILKNDGERLNSDQRKIINSIRSVLLKNGIEKLVKNPSIGEDFINKNLVYFERHFTKEQLYILVESPFISQNYSLTRPGGVIPNLVDPNGPPSSCTCLYNLGCPGFNNDCVTKNATCTLVTNCGLFGTSNCKGRCEGLQPDL
jgi:hypothetical protein